MALLAPLKRAAHVRFFRSLRRAHAALLPTLAKRRDPRDRPPVARLVLAAAAALLALLSLTVLLLGSPTSVAPIGASKPTQRQQRHHHGGGGGGTGGGGGGDATDGDDDERPDRDAVARARAKWPARPAVPHPLDDELWNSVKHDVVIGVKTGHEVAAKRLAKLREFGWWSVGRDVPNLLVLSDEDDAELGTVGVKPYGLELLRNASGAAGAASGTQPERDTGVGGMGAGPGVDGKPRHWFERSGWRGDKDKNLPALHVLRREFPGKKWYLLLDDDTYIFLENFARYVQQDGLRDADDAVYTGKVFYISRCGGFARDGTLTSDRTAPRGMFAHGGSGIVLNGAAMDRLFPALGGCIRSYAPCWAGDMQVALCLRRVGVTVRRVGARRAFEKHFIPFWPSKALADRRYSARWRGAAEPLTFHKLPDAEMRLVSSLDRVCARAGEPVVYTELREHLLRHGVLPAHSRRDRANKYYSTEFLPPSARR